MRRYQLGLLIALSLGMTGCQSSNSSTASSWNPTTWNWNPWASKETAVAKSDTKPELPSAAAVASRSATAPTGPTSYPSTGAPLPNFATAQNGAYSPQPTGSYPAQPAYGTAPVSGSNPNNTVPAGYMANGYGNYGQPAAAPATATAPAYGTTPAAGYGTSTPAYGTTPPYGTTPSAYGQQPYPGSNPYAQPPAQPGATPGYGQGASYDASNPSSAFGTGGFAGSANQQASATTPARNTEPYMPGSIKPMAGATSGVTQAGFELKPSDTAAPAVNAYGAAPAGMTCDGQTCYPNSSTTTATPAGYQPANYGSSNPAPATNAGGSFYR